MEANMRTNRLLTSTYWGLAFLLGQASVLLGLMLTLGWSFAFALIAVQEAGPTLLLPIGPPLIGLGLGAAGCLLGRGANPPVAKYGVAGLAFNAVPLALALLLMAMARAH
jgi:hypothetical protein